MFQSGMAVQIKIELHSLEHFLNVLFHRPNGGSVLFYSLLGFVGAFGIDPV